MQGSLDITNSALFESASMRGSTDLAVEGMLSTPKAGTTPKTGAQKPPSDPPEDWLDAPAFLVTDAFSGLSSGLCAKLRSGSLDGLLISKEPYERANSTLQEMVGSLDLADVLGSAQAPAAAERTFSKELAALDLPTTFGPRQTSAGSAMAMSISGSTEANLHSFLQSVENQSLPEKGSVRSLLSQDTTPRTPPQQSPPHQAAQQTPAEQPPASRVASFAQTAPVAAAHIQFAAVSGQQLPQPVANRTVRGAASTHEAQSRQQGG
eukprot:CAMPEP_0196741118 /NCGR_PEP_ID=MMETSP1091-20130531/37966_1 /TAXON_ID=302021 /ORGANISM="Rhodomonas sp., Strain CCMP768" /LENGTH=264 /DNA_ID=CAMNT_0042086643 /DNA_START=59 /DNA_END=849 /DNA_ORIENTATION=-